MFAEMAIDDLLPEGLISERNIINFTYEEIKELEEGILWKDSLLMLSTIRQGVPYDWGGDSWISGIDCSHFTRKVMQEVGNYYHNYMTTHSLKSVRNSNGLISVPIDEATQGDLLVYGYYNSEGKWSGHVVILVDAEYFDGQFRGLVVGSHGGGAGVRFITFNGFPDFYRQPHLKLRNVLRVSF